MAQLAVIDLLGDVAQICRQAPTPTLIRAYVAAAREFAQRSRRLSVRIDGATVAGTSRYALGNDPYADIFGLSGVVLFESAGVTRELQPGNSADWSLVEPRGIPEEFQYVPEAQVVLHPTPIAVFNMSIGAWIAPKRGATSIDASLVTQWEGALQEGALARLLEIPDVAWSDPRGAAMRRRRFIGLCTEAANRTNLAFNLVAPTLF